MEKIFDGMGKNLSHLEFVEGKKYRFCATLRCATEINLDMTNSTHPLVQCHSSFVLGRN